ncbi:GGDEF domain-containing protein [Devosia riboflavina]
MADNFAFLLPVMMATFSMVFFCLARMRLELPSAGAWGLAFGSGAAAFSVGLLPISPEWQALVGDVLFFVSFFAYGDGLLIHFGRPRYLLTRLSFIALCLVADLYIVFGVQSLELELLLVDSALTVLLAVPVALVATRPRHFVDQALVVVAGLVALDTLVRIVIFNTVLADDGAFAEYVSSQYSFFLQISGGALGLCFALAALGSILVVIVSRYREAAERDPLTRLYNRRGFEEALRLVSHPGASIGVILTCDIDHFKSINDNYGHAAGDVVIEGFAKQLADSLPRDAIAARFGGEEFIVYLPGASLSEGRAIAEAVRNAFGTKSWQHLEIARRVTISVGAAPRMPIDRSIHDTIARADRALYAAKAGGRNRVEANIPYPVAI